MLFIQAGVGAVTSNNDRYTLRFLLAYFLPHFLVVRSTCGLFQR